MRVYHFTNNIRVGFTKFYESIHSMGAIICFDFEDSIAADSADIDIVRAKNQHRTTILEQLIECNSEIELSKIGFRINSFSSMNYKEDLKALSLYGKTHTLFIPKVESARELNTILNDISFSVNEIIPIIETKRGFNNAQEILSINDIRYKRIAFGHCDYNLSLKYFPFFHHDSSLYWNWISTLNEIARECDKEIVNSPALELENEMLINYSKNKCQKFSQVTGHISLCKMHTQVLCSDTFSGSSLAICSPNSSSPELFLSTFEKYKVVNKSFALTSDRKIISPQERAMAIFKYNQ